MNEVPEGFERSRIPGKFKKELDYYYEIVVEDRGQDCEYWENRPERVRVYVLKSCGWTSTLKTFKTLKKAFEFAETVTAENWHKKGDY